MGPHDKITNGNYDILNIRKLIRNIPKMLCHVAVILIQNDSITFHSEMYRVVLKRSLTAVKMSVTVTVVLFAVIFRVIIRVKVRCNILYSMASLRT